MIPADEALERLRGGNERFAAGEAVHARHVEMSDDQAPIAVIIGCSDSRVPVEIVFDQGLGDLFVIRVAGNVVAPSQIGSVEFAAERFGTRLVVVLGHSRCGAVLATLEELRRPSASRSKHLRSIVDRIRPAVEGLVGAEVATEDLVQQAVRANIRASAEQLYAGSDLIEELRGDGLVVVGAEYSLETGRVEFLDADDDR